MTVSELSDKQIENGIDSATKTAPTGSVANQYVLGDVVKNPYLPATNRLGKFVEATEVQTNQHVHFLQIANAIPDADPAAFELFRTAVQTASARKFQGLLPLIDFQLDANSPKKLPLYIAFKANTDKTLREWLHTRSQLAGDYSSSVTIKIAVKLIQILDPILAGSSLRPVVLPDTIALDLASSQPLPSLLDAGFIATFSGMKKYCDRLDERQKRYIAPEVQQGTIPTTQSYIFSLTAILVELFTGQPPASDGKFQSQNLPPALSDMLQIALSADPDKRHASLQAYKEALLNTDFDKAQPITQATLPVKVMPNPGIILTYKDAVKGERRDVSGSFITIGSDPKDYNHIHLANDTNLIADRHACLWYGEEGKITITTMASHPFRPALLNGVPLSPNYAALVDESSRIKVGDYTIQLAPSPEVIATGRPNQYAAIKLQKSKITARAGEWVRIPVTFSYNARQVEELWAILEGVPTKWTATPLETIRLLQSEAVEKEIEIRLPAVAQSKAKTYELILRLISLDMQVQVAAKPIWITILPEHAFDSWLEPEITKARRPFQLFVNNQGNFTQTFSVRCHDKEKALRFDPPTAQMIVRPNATGVIVFESFPYARHWWGSEKRHQVMVDVSPLEGGTLQSELLQLTDRALIPGWVLPILASLVALIVLLAMTLFKPIFVEQFPNSLNKPVEGKPLVLTWQGRNDCFYSVNENGVTKQWLKEAELTNTYTVTAPVAGQKIEVVQRNCLFFAGTSWLVDVEKAPPTALPPPPAPSIADFVISPGELLIGQIGDLCFGWAIHNPIDKLLIEPLVGEVKPTENKLCMPIQSLFPPAPLQSMAQVISYTFTLTAINSDQAKDTRTQTINLYAPLCKVRNEITASYLWEGPAANFPSRTMLQGGQVLLARASPFYPVDRPNEGWLEVNVVTGDPRPAWVDLGTLDCGGISQLINALPSTAAIPPTPLPTQTVTPAPTVTPEPTVTPKPGPSVKVNVEPKIINAGGCVLVSWDIQNVNQIFLNGVGQVGNGEIQDCPTETKDYDWHIKVDDSNFIDRKLTVIVNGGGVPGNPTPPVQQ